jgi:hypothetical protein
VFTVRYGLSPYIKQIHLVLKGLNYCSYEYCTVRSESRCALRLRYVELVVSIEVAVAVCCCFTVFS